MRIKGCMVAYASLMLVAAPATAWAFGAGIGCADLPEYDRAVGALEGMPGACDMTVEQARQIVAQQQGGVVVQPAANLPPRVRRYHHRRHRHHPTSY